MVAVSSRAFFPAIDPRLVFSSGLPFPVEEGASGNDGGHHPYSPNGAGGLPVEDPDASANCAEGICEGGSTGRNPNNNNGVTSGKLNTN